MSIHTSRGLLREQRYCRYGHKEGFKLVSADRKRRKMGIMTLQGRVKRKIWRCKHPGCCTVWPGPEEVRGCGEVIDLSMINPY